MAIANPTVLSNVPAAVDEFYVGALLDEARAVLCHHWLGMKKSVRLRSGHKLVFRDMPDLAAQTTPVAGVDDPNAVAMTKNDQSVTLAKYVGIIIIEDTVEFTIEDPILTVAVERAGRQGGLTLEILCRNVMNAGTTVQYSGTAAARNEIVAKMDKDDLKLAVRYLENQNAEKFSKPILPTTGIGSTPLGASFFAYIAPNLAHDVRGYDSFIPVEEYPKQQQVYQNEIGADKCGIRYLMTTTAFSVADAGGNKGSGILSTTGSKADVYSCLIVAKNAYATVALDKHSMQHIIKDKSRAGSKADMYSSVAWKAIFAAKILRETRMVRIETAVSE